MKIPVHFLHYRRTPDPLRSRRGLSLVELGIVLLVVSLVVVGIYGKATSIGDEARLQRAIDDVVLLLTKSNAYKADQGDYAALSVAVLNTNGYSTGPLEDGDGENPWGQDYVLKVDSTDAQLVNLEIVTAAEAVCNRLATTLDGLIHNQESVECGTDKKTVTVKAR